MTACVKPNGQGSLGVVRLSSSIIPLLHPPLDLCIRFDPASNIVSPPRTVNLRVDVDTHHVRSICFGAVRSSGETRLTRGQGPSQGWRGAFPGKPSPPLAVCGRCARRLSLRHPEPMWRSGSNLGWPARENGWWDVAGSIAILHSRLFGDRHIIADHTPGLDHIQPPQRGPAPRHYPCHLRDNVPLDTPRQGRNTPAAMTARQVAARRLLFRTASALPDFTHCPLCAA
jgi:hypothetical protein